MVLGGVASGKQAGREKSLTHGISALTEEARVSSLAPSVM